MSERTAEKEFETLKEDLHNLLEAVAHSIRQKMDSTRARGEKVVEDVRETIETHPKTTAIIAGSVMFGIGILASKLWFSKNHR